MSYNIIKSDGTPLATVADGQTNSTASSLTLIGKNYAGYGTFLNENFVKVLENFASTSAPLYPLVGQLWWKTDTRLLQVYDKFGNWKTISGAQSSSDAPPSAIAGDLWFDTVNQQLKVYSGASWIVIGPSFTATTGTSGAIADTIVDAGLISHVVVKFYVQNSLIAILSKDATFTPGTTVAGFATIKPGLNLAADRAPALVYYDNANNSAYLGGIVAAQYITKTTPTVTTKVTVQNETGIDIQDATGSVTLYQQNILNNNVQLISTKRGNGLIIYTTPDNAGGALSAALTVDKASGLVSVSANPSTVLGIATKQYVDTADTAIKGYIIANVNTVNTNFNTLQANVLTGGTYSVYGNLRMVMSDLGVYTGGAGYANATAWTQLMSSGQNIAANIIALWGNTASFYSKVLPADLTNPGTGTFNGTGTIYANVKYLQTTVSSLQSDALRRDGAQTITGTLLPSILNNYDLGAAGFRFRNFFANTANIASIIHSGTVGSGDIGQPENRFGTIYLTTANVNSIIHNGTVGVGDIGTADSKFGTVYAATANVASIVHSGTTGTGDIGSSDQRFGMIYANGIDLSAASDSTEAGTFNVGALGKSGTSGTGDIGGPSARFGMIYANGIDLSAVSDSTEAGTFNVGALGHSGTTGSGDIGSSANKFGTVYATTFNGSAAGLTAIPTSSISNLPNSSLANPSVTLSQGTGVTITGGALSLGGTATIAIGQAVATTSDVTFNTVSIAGITKTGSNVAGNIGQTNNRFNAVFSREFIGTATSAYFADLAERFLPEVELTSGTVVTIGGSKEIVQENVELSEEVLGVISTDPAFKMNSDLEGGAYVAMAGRVPVRVVGIAKKGDRLTSAGNGCARVAQRSEWTAFNIIGRALADKTTAEEGLVEAVVIVR
jgi:hypothetical protein